MKFKNRIIDSLLPRICLISTTLRLYLETNSKLWLIYSILWGICSLLTVFIIISENKEKS